MVADAQKVPPSVIATATSIPPNVTATAAKIPASVIATATTYSTQLANAQKFAPELHRDPGQPGAVHQAAG